MTTRNRPEGMTLSKWKKVKKEGRKFNHSGGMMPTIYVDTPNGQVLINGYYTIPEVSEETRAVNLCTAIMPYKQKDTNGIAVQLEVWTTIPPQEGVYPPKWQQTVTAVETTNTLAELKLLFASNGVPLPEIVKSFACAKAPVHEPRRPAQKVTINPTETDPSPSAMTLAFLRAQRLNRKPG